MSQFRSRLPPPGSLIAFEAVARRLSFTRAADELAVSQAAASRQVAILEDFLGVRLFSRERRQIQLTQAGTELYGAVATGLGHMATAVEHLQAPRRGRQLSIATSIAFSTFWLMPRLPAFHAAHPELQLRLMTSDSQTDWLGPEVQLAVIYGPGAPPGTRAEHLFGEEVVVAGHPELVAGRAPPKQPIDLLGFPLLHMEAVYPAWFGWRQWLIRCGASPPRELPGPRFNNYANMIQAARGGQGLVLGWRRLIETELATGALVRAAPFRVTPDEAYHLVVPERAIDSPGVDAFRTWILAEADGETPNPVLPPAGRTD